MKQSISPLELALLLANFIFTAALITLPQILSQISKQSTWLLPLILYPIILFIFYLALRKIKSYRAILSSDQSSFTYKVLQVLTAIFLVLLYVRDLRALIDFIKAYYLPNTPIEILAIVLSLTLIYVGSSGLEVIARITVIQLITLGAIIVLLPLMLLNEIELANLLPIISPDTIPSLSKSSFLLFPWLGEAFILLLLLGNVSQEERTFKSIMIGVSFGLLLFSILIFLIISVLGAYVAGLATYPNILMIQEIHLTDFLDRLDMVIVIIWAPCLLSRLALLLYCIHRTFINLKVTKTTLLFTPIGLFLGILTVVLFKNNTAHLEFSFFSLPMIAIVIEVLLIGLFLILKFQRRHV
jgi:spore germination protein